MISENVYSLRVSQHLDASSISLRASLFSLSCLLPLEFPQQHITFSRDDSGIHETRRSFSSIVTASIDALGSLERWNDAVNAVLIFRLLRLSVATSVSKWTEISEWHLSLSNASQIIAELRRDLDARTRSSRNRKRRGKRSQMDRNYRDSAPTKPSLRFIALSADSGINTISERELFLLPACGSLPGGPVGIKRFYSLCVYYSYSYYFLLSREPRKGCV